MTLNPLAVPYTDDVSRGADSAHDSTGAATERVMARLLAMAEHPAGRGRPRLVVTGDRDADWPTPETDPAAAQAMLHTICWDSSYTEYDHALAARGAIAASRQQSGSWRGLPPHEDADAVFRLALEDRDIVLDAVHALGMLPEPMDRDFGARLIGLIYDLATEYAGEAVLNEQSDLSASLYAAPGGDLAPGPGDPEREAYMRALAEDAPASGR